MSELAAAGIQEHAGELAERTVRAMYATDPFWSERYGDRGRSFALEDNRHHLSTLEQALRADEPMLLTNYARWLQTVLTTRGMCSRHLQQNFALLADEIRLQDSVQSLRSIDYLQRAQDALIYSEGPGREVQITARDAASRAADYLYGRHPEWLNAIGAQGRARCQDDLEYHLSYLADALALDRSEIFVEYVRWIGMFLGRRAVPADHLLEALAAIRDTLERNSFSVRTAANELLVQASRALEATAG